MAVDMGRQRAFVVRFLPGTFDTWLIARDEAAKQP